MSDDRTLDPAWQVRIARERLGLEAEVLPGSHSPMLTRPAELAPTTILGSCIQFLAGTPTSVETTTQALSWRLGRAPRNRESKEDDRSDAG